LFLHELASEEQREEIIKVSYSVRLTSALSAPQPEGPPPRGRPAIVLEAQRGAVLLVASVLPQNPVADLDVQHVSAIFRPDDMLPDQKADLRRQAGDETRLQLVMRLRGVGQAARAGWGERAEWQIYEVRTLPEVVISSFSTQVDASHHPVHEVLHCWMPRCTGGEYKDVMSGSLLFACGEGIEIAEGRPQGSMLLYNSVVVHLDSIKVCQHSDVGVGVGVCVGTFNVS
jgi:hypothetical protein